MRYEALIALYMIYRASPPQRLNGNSAALVPVALFIEK